MESQCIYMGRISEHARTVEMYEKNGKTIQLLYRKRKNTTRPYTPIIITIVGEGSKGVKL